MEVVEVSSEKDILDPDRARLLAVEAVGDDCFLHLQDQQHALRKDVAGHLIIAMEVRSFARGSRR